MIWLCTVTTIVITANVPESSEDSVTNADAGSSKRQVRAVAVADLVFPVSAFVFGVSLLLNAQRIAAENSLPGMCDTS